MSFPIEQFVWSKECYSLRQFDKNFRRALPIFVQIADGYFWKDEGIHSFASGEVYYVPCIGQQPRVLVKQTSGRHLSIPHDFKVPFCLVDEQGDELEPSRTMSDIVKNFRTWGDKRKHVNVSKNDNILYISHTRGAAISETLDGAMEIINVYTELYLVAHEIVHDEIKSQPVGIPLTLPVVVRVCKGVASIGTEAHTKFLQRADHAVKRFSGKQVNSVLDNDIMVSSEEFVNEDGNSLIKPTSILRLSDIPSSPDVNSTDSTAQTVSLETRSRQSETNEYKSVPEDHFRTESSFSTGGLLSPADPMSSRGSVFGPGRKADTSVPMSSVSIARCTPGSPIYANWMGIQKWNNSLHFAPEKCRMFSESEVQLPPHLSDRTRSAAVSDGSLVNEETVYKKKKSKRGLKEMLSFLQKRFELRRSRPKQTFIETDLDSSSSGSSQSPSDMNKSVDEYPDNKSKYEECGPFLSSNGRYSDDWSIPSYPAPDPPSWPESPGDDGKGRCRCFVEPYLEPTEYQTIDSSSTAGSDYEEVFNNIICNPADYQEIEDIPPPVACKRSSGYSYVMTRTKPKFSTFKLKERKSLRLEAKIRVRKKFRTSPFSHLRPCVNKDPDTFTRIIETPNLGRSRLKTTKPRADRAEAKGNNEQSSSDAELKRPIEESTKSSSECESEENESEKCVKELQNSSSNVSCIPTSLSFKGSHECALSTPSCIELNKASLQSDEPTIFPNAPVRISLLDKKHLTSHSTDMQHETLCHKNRDYSKPNRTSHEISGANMAELGILEGGHTPVNPNPPITVGCDGKPHIHSFRQVFSQTRQVPSPPPLRAKYRSHSDSTAVRCKRSYLALGGRPCHLTANTCNKIETPALPPKQSGDRILGRSPVRLTSLTRVIKDEP